MGEPTTMVNKGNMEDPQKVDRELNVLGSPRILEGLVEHDLFRELLEEGEVKKRPPRAWRPLDPKVESLLSNMMIKKRLDEC